MDMSETLRVALEYYEALDTPISLGLALRVKYGEYASVMEQKVAPSNYACSQAYLSDASAVAFLKKLEGVKLPGLDPRKKALQTWIEGEHGCYNTNRRITCLFDDVSYYGRPVDPAFDNFVNRARGWVKWLIGQTPDVPNGILGPGATLSDLFGQTDVANKFSTYPTLYSHSLGLLSVWKDAWSRCVQENQFLIQEVRGNKHFTVPKTASTDRNCAKEASLNMYFQLALGADMRKRLSRKGIFLNDGKNLHMKAAQKASLDDDYVTIDLSNASDTVAHHLVKLLVPPPWYEALDQARARRTLFKGRYHELEKFSSMGNGFTFELETVLFFAICCSVSVELIPGVNVHVYGDDIIVPELHAKSVLAALSFWGFTPNEDKTFVSGEFRESCGGDYWRGRDVRPIYLKDPLNEPQKLIPIHNSILAHAHRFTDERISSRLRNVARNIRLSAPLPLRNIIGPSGLGDLVFHGSESECESRYRWNRKHKDECIRYIRVYAPVPALGKVFDHFFGASQLAAALYGITLRQNRVIGNGVSGYNVEWRPWS